MSDQQQQSAEMAPQEGGDLRNDAELNNALMSNPGVLARLQEGINYDTKLQAMAHYQGLPEPVKRRIRALKKLQFRSLEIEAEFYRELHELEMQYASKYESQLQRRRDIVGGGVEPTDEDADWPEDSESEQELAGLLRDKASVQQNGEQQQQQQQQASQAAEAAGVPDFWLTVLKNVDLVSQMIQENDEPILRHLTDVRTKLFNGEETGFQLEFHFAPNDYFSNEVLTKNYYMRMSPDREHPWSYEGPEIIRCSGCEILWRKGKNVTVKVVKKVQKHKGNGQKRTVTKTVETDSFFNFFNPPTQSIEELNTDGSESSQDEEIEGLLQSDFEIGHFLRDQVVPRAVLFFTGEGLEDEDDYDEEDEDEEDEDGEEMDEEDDQPAIQDRR